MTFLIIASSILLLVLLIVWLKVEPFISFLIVSIYAGLFLGIPLPAIMTAVQRGIGDLLGSLIIVITVGAMLGKIVASSGAAQRISAFLMQLFGKSNIHWAIALTGLIVGIPLFFNVGFVLLVPIVFTVAYQYKVPTMVVGAPMLAALSVTHGLLPPHPAPVALVAQFGANMGITLIYGILLCIPLIIIAGPLYAKSRWIQEMVFQPLASFRGENKTPESLPGLANSLVTSLLPVFLLIVTSLTLLQVETTHAIYPYLKFFSDPSVVMLISLLWATISLGILMQKKIEPIMEEYGAAVKDVALVILIIAGSGAFKQVLVESGVSGQIAGFLEGWDVNPLFLGWMIAAIIRVSIGSATVAALTAAGIIGPMLANSTLVDPNLMVLAIGSGSLIFSHFNDGGFWLVKEYFNLSIKQTLLSWSLIETMISIMGLLGVLALNLFV